MKKYISASIILSLSFLLVNAQQINEKNSSAKFTSIIQLGILEGDAGKTFGQIQLVNGFQQNAWFYGLGVGIDYYGSKRSIPLFVDVKRNLKKGNKTPFVFADGGYNVSWLRDSEKSYIGGRNYKPTGGMYYEAGIGYKFILKNKLAFGFSAGYSFKEQHETFPTSIIPLPANVHIDYSDYNNKFKRLSVKINYSF